MTPGRRVVVVGPYPTMPGEEAGQTFALVKRLVDDGDDVTVVSPEPSAAHFHADAGGARGAARLARLARGADKLIIRLDAAALGAGADPASAWPGRLALGALLRRPREVEVHLDRVPDRVSERWVNVVLGPADEIVVRSEEEKQALQRAGVATARVSVVERPAGGPGQPGPGEEVPRAVIVPAHASASDIGEVIRSRAAAVRADQQRIEKDAVGEASRPLRHLPPLERAAIRSTKPGVVFVKRFQRRLLAWLFDSVIQHVNRLHRATIEAVDALEAEVQGRDPSTRS